MENGERGKMVIFTKTCFIIFILDDINRVLFLSNDVPDPFCAASPDIFHHFASHDWVAMVTMVKTEVTIVKTMVTAQYAVLWLRQCIAIITFATPCSCYTNLDYLDKFAQILFAN